MMRLNLFGARLFLLAAVTLRSRHLRSGGQKRRKSFGTINGFI
jgi:hypothetical protein